MFTAQALTKGFWIPAWLAMWIPNIVLGAAGVFLLVSPRAIGRSADSHSAAGVGQTPSVERRCGSAPAAPVRRTLGHGAPALVIRMPHFRLPGPTLLDGYIAQPVPAASSP